MSRRARIARLEKAHGAGAHRMIVVQAPYGMSAEAVKAQLGIKTGTYGMLIICADFSDPPGPPCVVSGDAGAGQ